MQKLELKQKEEDTKSSWAFGIGERNERGDHLFDFAKEQVFQEQTRSYWACESPDGENRNQIDIVLSKPEGKSDKL